MSKFPLRLQKSQIFGVAVLLCITLATLKSSLAITAFTPANQPIGYVGQDEVTNYVLSSGQETLFRPNYKKDYWGGNLYAYPVDAVGNVNIVADHWGGGASINITKQDWDAGRFIATMSDAVANGTPGVGGVPFRFASLSAAQQATLPATISTVPYSGTNIVNFLRGERVNESPTGLRQRSLSNDPVLTGPVLGDIIHSRPFFVNDEQNPTVFVGSNDGMLHAINATGTAPAPSAVASCTTATIAKTTTSCSGTGSTTSVPVTTCTKPIMTCANCGQERWAYVPSMLISKLKTLAYNPADGTQPYAHDFFVDGQINIATLPNNSNKRVLVGGLGAGGMGLYALNITDSSSTAHDGMTAASEADVSNKVLWEITSTKVNYATPQVHTNATTTMANAAAYSHLGYTYGTPTIATINYGGTPMDVVIIGNGYDPSASGESYLYVINAMTGALVRAIQAGPTGAANPNGLSNAVAVPNPSTGYVDRVYAGDLNGTMWKFDLSSTTPSSWSASALLVTSPAQPITATPGVTAHPNGGYMVTFGTGRIFTGTFGTYNHTTSAWTTASTGDLADTSIYYVYGVWDGAPAGNAQVLTQTLTERSYTPNIITTSCSSTGATITTSTPSSTTIRVRRSTANAPNWAAGGTKSWKVALPAGERVIGEGSVVDSGRYHFIGYNPTVAPYNVPGTSTDVYGENWLMELDVLSGGSSANPIFDLNGDLLLNDSDRITYSAGDTLPAGKAVGDPILSPNQDGIAVGKWLSTGVQSQPIVVQLSTLNTTLFNQNPDVVFPPTTPTVRGVAGGHFDVDNFWGTNNNCSSVAGAGSAASGSIQFTYSGSKTISSFSITINGTNILSANNPPSSSNKSALATWIASHINSANYSISRSSSTINITANNMGVAFNASAANMVVSGSGITSSDYSKTALTGGVNATSPTSAPGTSCNYVTHVHEYDKTYDRTGVNMLNASDAVYNLANHITSTSTNFKVLMMNQYLNPATTLNIAYPAYNPSSPAGYISVKNYQTSASLDITTVPTYNLNTIGSLVMNMPVDAFSIKDWWGNGDQRAGVMSVAPQCAWSGSGVGADMYQPVVPPADGADGPGTAGIQTGARHNGTLTIQIIKDTTPQSAIEQNVAGRPEYGYRVNQANFYQYVLAEYIFYWHHPRGMCYSSSGTAWSQTNNSGNAWNTVALMSGHGWTKAPPPDIAVSTANGTPAPGSTDPKLGVLGNTGTVASTTTTTAGNVTTTTITYNDGTKQVITSTANSNGTLTTTIAMYAADGTVTNSTTTVTANASGSVKTGGDERGTQARTGRISWHELIRP